MTDPTPSLPALSCVLFDLDGTLVDSEADLAAALDIALSEHGFRQLGDVGISAFVGDGARKLVERALTFVGSEASEADRVLPSFFAAYTQTHLQKTQAYPGVRATLERLVQSGVRCAVVTNKPAGFSESIVEHLGLRQYFVTVIGGDSLATKKPNPEPVLAALRACDASAHAAVMVGDGETDMVAGTSAGLYSIGVTWGFRNSLVLAEAGADALIDSMDDLLKVLSARFSIDGGREVCAGGNAGSVRD